MRGMSAWEQEYEAKGARLGCAEEALSAEMVLAFDSPDPASLPEGCVLVCSPNPLADPQTVERLAQRKVTCLALELMPRISRAQAMDVLSSMANVGGYKEVLRAAARSPIRASICSRMVRRRPFALRAPGVMVSSRSR